MAATTIVSDPDTDDEAVPEDERFYFFCIASHQVMSKVSRSVPPKEVTFGHVRQGLEGSVGTEFRFLFPFGPPSLIYPSQEEDKGYGPIRLIIEAVASNEFGNDDGGRGTRSDPYRLRIDTEL